MNTQITEDYVSFEVAKLLKEKGFDEPTCGFYYNNYTEKLIVSSPSNHNGSINVIAAPSQAHAIKWLREVHHIFISINITRIGGNDRLTYLWIPCVIKQDNIDYPTMEEYMADSYKEACESAIKYCLNNLI